MNKAEVLDRIHKDWLVTIFRAESGAEARDAFEAMIAGGATAVEVTLTTPDAYAVIESLRNRHGDRIVACAGTVTTVDQARKAIDAGAQAIVSPNLYPPVVEATLKRDAVAIPGCFTPTEFADATRCGADIIKLFPCDMVGPEYLSYIRGPFPDVRIMPVGRITLENMQSYYDKGVCRLRKHHVHGAAKVHSRRPVRPGGRDHAALGRNHSGHDRQGTKIMKVAVTDYAFDNLDIETRILEAAGCRVVGQKIGGDPQQLIPLVKDADCVITQFAPVNADGDRRHAESARSSSATGSAWTTSILKAAAAKNIPVCNVPDYCIDEVADHALAMILDLTRKIAANAAKVKAGGWGLAVPLGAMFALKDMTVGVVGFGRHRPRSGSIG